MERLAVGALDVVLVAAGGGGHLGSGVDGVAGAPDAWALVRPLGSVMAEPVASRPAMITTSEPVFASMFISSSVTLRPLREVRNFRC
jgi:hypothetical protein